jgi:hypothetical protein
MKAIRLALGFRSVFAVAATGEVWLIDRSEDGLWTGWQATRISATAVVSAGTMVATIDPDGRVATFERGIWQAPQILDRAARELVVTLVPGRGAVLLAADEQGIWSTWKESPSAQWHPCTALEGDVHGIDATPLPDDGVAIFGLRDGEVHHAWHKDARAGWDGWTSLGAPAGPVSMVRAETISGGGLAMFAVGRDGAVYHRWQDKPFGPWHPWESLGGEVRSVAVTKSSTGGLAIFAVGTDDTVRYRWQPRPFGRWNPWTSLYGRVRDIAAQPSYTDGLEAFAIALDGEVHHTWCERVDAPWTAWTALDYEISPFHSPVARGML